MGQNLYWIPEVKPQGHYLPDALKSILRKEYDLHGAGTIFGQGEVGFFQGLKAAGVEGAEDLIAAITQHGEVRVYLD